MKWGVKELSEAQARIGKNAIMFYHAGRSVHVVSKYGLDHYCHTCDSYHCEHIKQALIVQEIYDLGVAIDELERRER